MSGGFPAIGLARIRAAKATYLFLGVPMKKLLALAILVLAASTAQAQTHSASFSWTDPTTGAVYNLYRAPCTGTVTNNVCSAEGTFVKIATTPVNAASATDATLAAGQSYSWYATTLCAPGGQCPAGTQGESAPSNHVAGSTAFNIPPPPTLTLTSVASNINGNTQTVLAKWADTSGTQQSFFFTDGNKVIAQGLTSSLTGTFAEQWAGNPTSTVWFTVCNSVGQCATQKAM